MLNVEAVTTGYVGFEVVSGISLHVGAGECVAMVGANGAGKTTILRAISGLIPLWSGCITFDDCNIGQFSAARIVQAGLVHVPEGRELFPTLTVEENLLLGASSKSRKRVKTLLETVHAIFPILVERKLQIAGSLSGGEQQMLAIGRGLMSEPKLLLLDEPSLGLAPQLVDQVFDTVRLLRSSGLSILLVDQNVEDVMALADRSYVLQSGQMVLEGHGSELLADSRFEGAFLGR